MGYIEEVLLTPLRIIKGEAGDVLHALKQQEESFYGFGEAYFSTIRPGVVKGWKKHRKMILNVVVPVGSIRFVLYDDRSDSSTYKQFQELTLSPENYQRLTVPVCVWMAFQGLGQQTSMLLNIASISHDPMEAENLPIQNEIIPFAGFA